MKHIKELLKKAGWGQASEEKFSITVGSQQAFLTLRRVENIVSLTLERVTHIEDPRGPTFLYDDLKVKKYIFSEGKKAYDFVEEYIKKADLAKNVGIIPHPSKKWDKYRA